MSNDMLNGQDVISQCIEFAHPFKLWIDLTTEEFKDQLNLTLMWYERSDFDFVIVPGNFKDVVPDSLQNIHLIVDENDVFGVSPRVWIAGNYI